MSMHLQDWGSSFDQLAAQMRAMLKQMHGQELFRSQPSGAWPPRINLYETQGCFFVCAELAGMDRDEIDVDVTDGELRLRGVRPKPTIPECPVGDEQCVGVGVHLMEIDSGEFERRVKLPADVVVGQVSAVYREGYLWVVLPRTGETNAS